MKKLIVFVVLAAAFAVVTAKAAAPFTITGTATFSQTNYVKGSSKGTNYVATMVTKSFNNKSLYILISNAVANASNGSNNLAKTLPADGYIGYFPEYFDGKYNGYFYVADKKGFYFPLSGFDNNLKHYSFMELSTYDQWLGDLGSTNYDDDDCCCCDDDCGGPLLNFAYSENYNPDTGTGTYKGEDTARISIRSIPYFGQQIEQSGMSFTGTFSPSFTFKDFQLWSPSSASFTGIGDVVLQNGADYQHGVINSLSIKFSF
jgi:hypothetical protein